MYRCFSISLVVALSGFASAQLTLPYSGTDPSTFLSSFQITKSGSAGRANTLYISNALNTHDVLLVNTIGLGKAAYFSINNTANATQSLRADSNGNGLAMLGLMTGPGRAGLFRITNPANSSYALQGQTDGSGPAIRGQAGTGLAGDFVGGVRISNEGLALQVIGGSTFTGTATFTNAVATQFSGGGAGLTNLSASNVTTGTLNSARLTVPLKLEGYHAGKAILSGTNTSGEYASTGVSGYATEDGLGFGGYFRSNGYLGVGVYGYAPSTSSDSETHTTGGYFRIDGTGEAVLGYSSSTHPGSESVGGYFESAGGLGAGVYGRATKVGAGYTYGGNFLSFATNGIGVLGTATGNEGSGVVGDSNSASGFGVYANGNLGASGTKSFKIDHPFDPANKYLLHYSTEMPEPQNAYNGTIVTDARGEAWVDLPDYFSEINKEPRYQLTVVDDHAGPGFVQVKVARKIRNNRFLIMTSAPRVEVSWEVKAVRNDLWVRKNGAPVEVEKVGLEKGKYQHPDLYGKPKELGIRYRPAHQVPVRKPTLP